MGNLRFSIFLLLVLLASGALSATAENPKYGGTLRIGIRKDITTLDPFVQYSSTNALVGGLVYEGLTDVSNSFEAVPSLAESWSISKDGKQYIFQLRKGVIFHHGKELDAEDVKWSLEHILDPKNRAYMRGLISEIESVQVLDRHSVKLALKQPFAPLLATGLNSDTVIVPKDSIKSGDTLTVALPGTGPFQHVEWKRGTDIRQAANKRYWNKGVPYLSEVVFKPVPSADVRFISLRSGDLDLIEEAPYVAVNEVKKGRYTEVRLAPAPIAGFRLIKMNVEAPYFKDPRVRRAVAYAVDRKAYIDGATLGHGEPAYQVYPKGFKWYFDDVQNQETDLQKARALLAEAGFPQGFKSTLEIRQGEESENLILQDQLKKVGIDLEIQSMDFASYVKSDADGTFHIKISGSNVYPDIDRALYPNFHSEVGPKRNRNDTGYKNPEVDRLLDRARTVTDFKERQDLYKRVTEILNQDSPQVNLAFIPRFYAYKSHVKGFVTNPNGDLVYPEGGVHLTWIDAPSR